METQKKGNNKKTLNKFGWGLFAIACITRYLVASTDQDYINAPSRQNVKNPNPNATFQEDIKPTDTLICISWATAISGVVCLLLSSKQKSK